MLLFIIGLIGPDEEKLKGQEYVKKLENIPKFVGILYIGNAFVNGFIYFFLLGFVLAYD